MESTYSIVVSCSASSLAHKNSPLFFLICLNFMAKWFSTFTMKTFLGWPKPTNQLVCPKSPMVLTSSYWPLEMWNNLRGGGFEPWLSLYGRLGNATVGDRVLGPFLGCWAKPTWISGVMLLPLKMKVQLVTFFPLD